MRHALLVALALFAVSCSDDPSLETLPLASPETADTIAGEPLVTLADDVEPTLSDPAPTTSVGDDVATTTTAPTTTPAPTTTATPTTTVAPVERVECVLRLHGRGASGGDTQRQNGLVILRPQGNGADATRSGWAYQTPAEVAEITAILEAAVAAEGCTHVVADGFSNGGGAVGALVCDGYDLGGLLIGAIMNDPVRDEATQECSPPPLQGGLVLSTSFVDQRVGRVCSDINWTCQSDSDVIQTSESYAAAGGFIARPSARSNHNPENNPPEQAEWFASAP